MQFTSSKHSVLSSIRQALSTQTPQPYETQESVENLLARSDDDIAVCFAERLLAANGKLVFCADTTELADNLKTLIAQKNWRHVYTWEPNIQDFLEQHDIRERRIGKHLERAEVGITSCEALLARTGSVLLSSRQASGRSLSIFPPVHIVFAHTRQLHNDLHDALQNLQKWYGNALPSMLSVATGPSRSADIEKTLLIGAHGTLELYVFLLDN